MRRLRRPRPERSRRPPRRYRGRVEVSSGCVEMAARHSTGSHHQEKTMSRYVDGFVLPVPRKNLAQYRRVARVASKVWRDHGALEYVECVADQLTSKHDGKTFTSLFPKLAKVKPGEV